MQRSLTQPCPLFCHSALKAAAATETSERSLRGKEHIWYVRVVIQPSITQTSGKVSTPERGDAADHSGAVRACVHVLMEAGQYAVTEQSAVLSQ